MSEAIYELKGLPVIIDDDMMTWRPRTWRERLFGRPWRPWRGLVAVPDRTVRYINVGATAGIPSDVGLHKGLEAFVMHTATWERLRDALLK